MVSRLLISMVVLASLRLAAGADLARAQESLDTLDRAAATYAATPALEQAALAHLERAIAHDAAEARRVQRVRSSTSAALGAVLVPVGSVLLRKDDPVQSALGVGLVVGGATQLANSLMLFIPSALERLQRDHAQRAARPGVSQGELLRETQRIWRTRASAERAGRRSVGIAYAALGAALVPAGVTLLLADRQLFEMSKQGQYKLGAALLGMGAPFLSIGLQLGFEPGPLERSYAAYAHARPELLGARLSAALLPARGGAYLGVVGRY